MIKALNAEPGQEEYNAPLQFKDHARKWATFFREVHFDEDVTPYIHGEISNDINNVNMGNISYRN